MGVFASEYFFVHISIFIQREQLPVTTGLKWVALSSDKLSRVKIRYYGAALAGKARTYCPLVLPKRGDP